MLDPQIALRGCSVANRDAIVSGAREFSDDAKIAPIKKQPTLRELGLEKKRNQGRMTMAGGWITMAGAGIT